MTLARTWNAVAVKLRSTARPAGVAEVRRRRMMAAGERLIDALKIEKELLDIHMSLTEDEALLDWKESRRTVERLAEDYDWTVAQWREAAGVTAEAEPGVAPPRSEASEWLRQLTTLKVAGGSRAR